MTLSLERGWLNIARRCPSPNHDQRPEDCAVDLIVIHNISLPAGVFGGPYIDALFTNQLDLDAHPSFAELKNLRVSSHLLIRRDGEVVQYVPLHLRAWHAGVSRFQGRAQCNDFSIGIELEGTDQRPYTAAQYRILRAVVRFCQQTWPQITDARITGHADIAPQRKTDPGPAFDWNFLQGEHSDV